MLVVVINGVLPTEKHSVLDYKYHPVCVERMLHFNHHCSSIDFMNSVSDRVGI